MNILEIKNLNLNFRSGSNIYRALYDVNLNLKKGTILAIAGESGCGKTVTAMSVLKLLAPNAEITSGEILYKGKNLLSLSEKAMREIRGKEISLIPQDPMTSLNPLFTIGEQLTEVIELHRQIKGEAARKTAAEVLDIVKIPNAKERLKSYPHEFSGGMRQRVIIAAAIACRSEIIIADEPTTALDVTVQAQITELIKEIKRELNTSFIFISHDFGLVSEIADDIAVMYAGRVLESSAAKEMFEEPKHPYTQALLKALPNMQSVKLHPIEGQPPSVKDEFPGCPFAPRCKNRLNECRQSFPDYRNVKGSNVARFLYK